MNKVAERTNTGEGQPGERFREIRRIMAEPYDDMEFPAPWTEADFREYAQQEPLPPNQSPQLTAEEQIELAIEL